MDNLNNLYDETFYDNQRERSYLSASKVLRELRNWYEFKSVVDFGCGKGTWLRAAQENGALYLQGYDGPWADKGDMEFLNLPKPCESTFSAIDFENFLSQERTEGKKFDLAMSLEVIEHLSDETGRALISWLCQSSDVVLFSCAIPGQGGTNHINERWLSYWIPLFKEKGFQPWDFLRPKIWTDPEIDVWYRQNVCVFVKQKSKSEEILVQKGMNASGVVMDIVHPELFASRPIGRKKPKSLWVRFRDFVRTLFR